MKRTASRLALLMGVYGVGFSSTGCGGGFGCGAGIIPGIIISVYDARTGLPAVEGATATAQDGERTETLDTVSYDINGVLIGFQGAGFGTYTVRVNKPGYTAFEQTDVRVTGGDCFVNTVRLRADLVPIP